MDGAESKASVVAGAGAAAAAGASQSRPARPSSSERERSSPPPDCAICLAACRNKCFTDSCLHQFCFECLLTWSKIKAECPLCKQPFKVIIHNVKANDQYEEYEIREPPPEEYISVSYDVPVPRFRYSTTFTVGRQQEIEIQRLLRGYPVERLPESGPTAPSTFRRPPFGRPLSRRNVYEINMWARPLPDVTGRYRECSPEFYRNNPAQIHRLVVWLRRELAQIIPNVDVVLPRIIDYLTVHPILSPAFAHLLTPYLRGYAEHFLHEFHSFASSPYDLIGYDRTVQYSSGPYSRGAVANLPVDELSSDSESDVEIVYASSEPFRSSAVPAGSSTTIDLGTLGDSVIPIESVDRSDGEDSDDEVVMVGYVKPPESRTPEFVDLAASDSDAVVVEESRRWSPIEVPDERDSSNSAPRSSVEFVSNIDLPSSSGLVKLSLKRSRRGGVRVLDTDSDSDGDVGGPRRMSKTVKRSKKYRRSSANSVSTECTDGDTDRSGRRRSSFADVTISTSDESISESRESRIQNLAYKIKKRFNARIESGSERERRLNNISDDSEAVSDSNEERARRASDKCKGVSYKSLSKYADKSKSAPTNCNLDMSSEMSDSDQ